RVLELRHPGASPRSSRRLTLYQTVTSDVVRPTSRACCTLSLSVGSRRSGRAGRSAAGGGLCPPGGSQTQDRSKLDCLGRLLRRLTDATVREEGANEGTRGSLVL